MGTILENVGEFLGFLWSLFVIAAFLLCLFDKKVRDSYIGFVSIVVETTIQICHIHIYRGKKGWARKNWGGIACLQRTRQCRCGATKMKIRGILP